MHRYQSLCIATIVAGSVMIVGCGPNASPTSPASEAHLSTANALVNTPGASSSTVVLSIPVRFTIQPAAQSAIKACVGEVVAFVGEANLVAHLTTLPDGATSLDVFHVNPQGAVAVGASTGTTYRLVGGDVNPIVLSPSGTLTATFAANLLVIGSGGEKSFMAHILQHITISPAGDISALFEFLSIDCR